MVETHFNADKRFRIEVHPKAAEKFKVEARPKIAEKPDIQIARTPLVEAWQPLISLTNLVSPRTSKKKREVVEPVEESSGDKSTKVDPGFVGHQFRGMLVKGVSKSQPFPQIVLRPKPPVIDLDTSESLGKGATAEGAAESSSKAKAFEALEAQSGLVAAHEAPLESVAGIEVPKAPVEGKEAEQDKATGFDLLDPRVSEAQSSSFLLGKVDPSTGA